jgi:hypothetical protein
MCAKRMARIINVAVRDGITAIGLFGAMLWIDWQLTLVAMRRCSAGRQPHHRHWQEAAGALQPAIRSRAA